MAHSPVSADADDPLRISPSNEVLAVSREAYKAVADGVPRKFGAPNDIAMAVHPSDISDQRIFADAPVKQYHPIGRARDRAGTPHLT